MPSNDLRQKVKIELKANNIMYQELDMSNKEFIKEYQYYLII